MNLTVEINNAEIRTCEYLLEMFAKPEVYSPYMIERFIRSYSEKLRERNAEIEDRYCDTTEVTITDV